MTRLPTRFGPRARLGLRLTATGLAIAAAAVGFWLFCEHMRQGAITADWPWLWRTGQSLWRHGLPATDTLSWTFQGHPWVLYQWLFEAVSAPIYDALGLSASVLAVCLLGFGMYMAGPAWYLARRGVHPLITLAVGGLVLIPVSVNLGLRPMLASNLALLAQIVVLERIRAHRLSLPAAAVVIALLYALWANSHLGFTLGLTSLLLYGLADIIEHRRPERRAPIRSILIRYGVLGCVAVAAIGLNPYGWSLFGYIWHLSNESAMNAHIHELMPPDPWNPYMTTGIVLLVVYAGLVVRARHRLDWAGLLHVALFSIGTAVSLRFVVWAALFFVLSAPRLIAPTPRSAVRESAPPRPLAGLWAAGVLAAIAIAGPVSAYTAGPARLADCAPLAHGIRYLDRHLPADAHWFSSERVGSCTHVYAPHRRVFIDTRFDMYPESFVMDWFRAYQYRRDWQHLFNQWHIDTALLGPGAPLFPILSKRADFQRQRLDGALWLFTRRHAAHAVASRPSDTTTTP